MGLLTYIFLLLSIILLVGLIYFRLQRKWKIILIFLLGFIVSILLLTGYLIIPFYPPLYCNQMYHRNIVVCKNSIIFDYGAPAADGTQTCYNRIGWYTGYIGGWGHSGGICNEEECTESINLCVK